jgi:hypothetical protein
MARRRLGMTSKNPEMNPICVPESRGKRRRGTVLLFALGVLAVISVAAVSYVTFVRVDRNASSAAARTVGFDRQADRMIDEIGGVIAADLWGGKLVTPDVPKDIDAIGPSEKPLWPRMFEDGEYRDYPFTNFVTFNRDLAPDVSSGPSVQWHLRVGADRREPVQVAPPDDAWLAPIDPIWDTMGGAQSHWRQITNMRSVWTYDDNGTPDNVKDDRWIRGDGKYVDLGQVLSDPRRVGSDDRGNPGTNLLDPALGAVLPRNAAGDFARAPYRPMNFMSGNEPVFTPSDERFWADTDGDLRADARWQLIDSLGTAEGLLWVTATRIVDLSGMVNINSAIEGGFPSGNIDDYAEGRSPADVDLYRLVLNDISGEGIIPADRQWDWTGSAYPAPATNRLRGNAMPDGGTFSDHLIRRLRLIDLTQPGVLADPNPDTVGDFELATNWNWDPTLFGRRLSGDQRFEYWRSVGSTPGRGPSIDTPSGPVRSGYTNDVMIDLHAFTGSNNRSILSKWEETIDGPDNLNFPGYLPRPEDAAGDPVGPLGSRKRPGDDRFFANASTQEPSPTTLGVRSEIRRLMTTVNGVSDVSPVPVLNFAAEDWQGERPYASQYLNRKIRLKDFSLKDVPAAYESFVWALAPTATSVPVVGFHHQNPALGSTVVRNVPDAAAHYGGPDEGNFLTPVNGIDLSGGVASVEYGPTSGASFATITSAALALNLNDATDEDSDPSVARLLVAESAGTGSAEIHRSRILDGKAYLSNRFGHGDIPSSSLPINSLGNLVDDTNLFEQHIELGQRPQLDTWLTRNDTNSGVTLVGAERTAYIGEVFAVGVFENATKDIVLDVPGYQAGAVLAVQMVNPWPTDMVLSGFELVFVSPKLLGNDRLLSSPENLRFRFPAGAFVPAATPGTLERTTFLFMSYAPTKPDYRGVIGNAEGDDLSVIDPKTVEGILRGATADIGAVFVDPLVPADDDTRKVIADYPAFVTRMRNNEVAGEKFAAVLRRPAAGLAELAVVDILETTEPFFGYNPVIDLADPALGFDRQYFIDLGYTKLFDPLSAESVAFNSKDFAGRVMLASSVTRPIRTSGGTNTGWFSYAAIQPFGADAKVRDIGSGVSYYAHAWLAPIPGPPAPFVARDLVEPLIVPTTRRDPSDTLVSDSDLELITAKTSDTSYADRNASSGGWQLFIPNRPLQYLSELHLLSTFAHTCKNNQLDNLEAWATVGAQLRWTMSNQYDRTRSDCDNPYLGVLNPSRFMPDGGAFPDGGFPRDDSLAIPLAARVFDCFEAIDHPDALAQGRVNINTAPERVLQMLPLMAPANSLVLDQNNNRVDFLLRYRDAWTPGDALGDRVDYTQFNSGLLVSLGNTMNIGDSSKIRRHDQSHANFSGVNIPYVFTNGIATVGELTFLDLWGFDGAVQGGFPSGFLTPIGNDGTDAGETAGGRRVLEGELSVDPDKIVDDPEERLALYRAVSNIVSSRSDVYGAWFILRGYDPKMIEAIKVDDPGNVNAIMDLSENNFLPAYESRWFVIFDRSNCRTPTDRPRVLLKAQLPSSRP